MPLHARNSANSLTVWLDPVCSGQKFEVMMATRGATAGALMPGEPLLHTATSYQVQVPSLRMTVSPRCFVAAPRLLLTLASLRTKGMAIMPEGGPDRSYAAGGGRRAHQPTPSPHAATLCEEPLPACPLMPGRDRKSVV